MNYLSLVVLALAIVQAATLQATEVSKVNVCYQEFREEMVTAALYTTKEKGFFKNEGIDVNWIQNGRIQIKKRRAAARASRLNTNSAKPYFVNSVPDIELLQTATEKGCDFVSTTFEAALGSNVDLGLYAPLAVYRYGRDYDTHLVVRADSKIQSMKDLKGKTVRFNQVGSLIAFEGMLKKAGLSPQDVKYERANLASLGSDLDKGKFDVVLSYNPTIPLLLGSGRVRILEKNLFSSFYAKSIPHSVLLVKRKLLNENKDMVARFMKAFAKGADDLASKPENMIHAVPNVKKLYTNAQIEKSLAFISLGKPLLVTQMTPETFFAESHFAEYASILKDHGFLKASADLSTWKK